MINTSEPLSAIHYKAPVENSEESSQEQTAFKFLREYVQIYKASKNKMCNYSEKLYKQIWILMGMKFNRPFLNENDLKKEVLEFIKLPDLVKVSQCGLNIRNDKAIYRLYRIMQMASERYYSEDKDINRGIPADRLVPVMKGQVYKILINVVIKGQHYEGYNLWDLIRQKSQVATNIYENLYLRTEEHHNEPNTRSFLVKFGCTTHDPQKRFGHKHTVKYCVSIPNSNDIEKSVHRIATALHLRFFDEISENPQTELYYWIEQAHAFFDCFFNDDEHKVPTLMWNDHRDEFTRLVNRCNIKDDPDLSFELFSDNPCKLSYKDKMSRLGELVTLKINWFPDVKIENIDPDALMSLCVHHIGMSSHNSRIKASLLRRVQQCLKYPKQYQLL